MRSFWIALVLIFIFIIMSIYFSIVLEKNSKDIVTRIDNMKKKINNNHWEEVEKDFTTLIKKWERTHHSFSPFIEHTSLDGIHVSLLKAGEYINENNKILAKAELSTLKYLIQNIYLSDKLNFGNIF